MPGMSVSVSHGSCQEGWDAYVDKHPGATPYHYSAWLESVKMTYGMGIYYLMVNQGDNVVGVLPLVLIKKPMERGVLVSLPYCDMCSVLADGSRAEAGLLREAVRLSMVLKVKSIDLRGPIKNAEFSHLGFILQQKMLDKVSMVLKLPDSSEDLWNGFKSKLRSQVRKAEKNGLTFVWGSLEDVDDFYNVFSRNMRDLGSPVHSRRWFESVLHSYGSNAGLGLVYKGEVPVGGAIILKTGSRLAVPWASTLRNFNRLSPNMLLYWNMLKFAVNNNCLIFDFGRSTPGEGTYRFKAQWGARPEKLNWYSLGQNLEQGKASCLFGPSSRQLTERIWRSLPLPAANFLGPLLRKYISL